MAKLLPIVQLQRDLKTKLQEAKLVDYYEHVCQSAEGTFNPMYEAVKAHPTAQLVMRGDGHNEFVGELDARMVIAGQSLPSSSVIFMTPNAVFELVKEAKQIYTMTEQLLHWLKEKKLDQ